MTMLRIGDFSRLAQVSIRALRLYDEMGLLKPAQIDRFTDYRYYAVEQLPRLNRILALKDLGLALDQIRSLIERDLPIEQLEGMLLMKQQDLEQSLKQESIRLQRVEARLRQLRREGVAPAYDVVVKSATAQWIAGRRIVIPTLDDMATIRCHAFTEVLATFTALRLKPGDKEMAIYHVEEYAEENLDTELAYGIDPAQASRFEGTGLVARQLPFAPLTACVIHHGRAEQITEAATSVFRWMATNGLSSAGPLREIHLDYRETNHDYTRPVTVELQLPVTE